MVSSFTKKLPDALEILPLSQLENQFKFYIHNYTHLKAILVLTPPMSQPSCWLLSVTVFLCKGLDKRGQSARTLKQKI